MVDRELFFLYNESYIQSNPLSKATPIRPIDFFRQYVSYSPKLAILNQVDK